MKDLNKLIAMLFITLLFTVKGNAQLSGGGEANPNLKTNVNLY